MSSIKEVARAAGVSIATVSRALSSPEKVSAASMRKVQAAIAELQYHPNIVARNLRSARAHSLLVLVPDISNPFFSLVIRAIEDRAHEKGYSVLFGDTRDSPSREREYIRLVESRLADGIIQLRPDAQGDASNGQVRRFAYINLCGAERTSGPTVRIDNVHGAREMVEYLISLGHQRIGVITGFSTNAHTVDRMEGYKQALAAASIPFDQQLVAEGDYSMWSGLGMANQYCRMDNPPTALFCMNDEMAIGACQTLKSNGFRVPEDVSVTGFDNIDYARYSDPPLTTISQPADQMGKMATDLLLRLIDGEELSQAQYILPYEFIIRKSTGPVRSTEAK